MRKFVSVLVLLATLLSLCSVGAMAAEAEETPTVELSVRGGSNSVTLTITAAEPTTNGKLEVEYPENVELDTYTIEGVATSVQEGAGKLVFGYAVPVNRGLAVGDKIAEISFRAAGGAGTADFTVNVLEFNKLLNAKIAKPISFTFGSAPSGGGSSGETAESTQRFVDVPAGNWASAAVNYGVEKGYLKGVDDTHFAPNVDMTRAQFVTVLGRVAGADETAFDRTQFVDVAAQSYYAGYVAWGQKTGLVTGVDDTHFIPERPVNREEMAVLMYRYAVYTNGDLSVKENALDGFTDADEISSWARDAVEWAVSHNVVRGKGAGVMDPKGCATRAEVAQLIMNYIENLG